MEVEFEFKLVLSIKLRRVEEGGAGSSHHVGLPAEVLVVHLIRHGRGRALLGPPVVVEHVLVPLVPVGVQPATR